LKDISWTKAGGHIGLAVIILCGLIMTSIKTVRVIQATIPEGDHLTAFFALGMLDGGLLIWLLVNRLIAKGGWKKFISGAMVFVCLAGVIAAMFLDVFMQTGKRGLTVAVNSDQLSMAIIAVYTVIALNIMTTVFMHLIPSPADQPAFFTQPQPVYNWQVMPPPPPTYSLPADQLSQAPALQQPAEINPTLIEVRESESQPGHFANEVQAPFLGTKPTV
jgi:hypothetical protein